MAFLLVSLVSYSCHAETPQMGRKPSFWTTKSLIGPCSIQCKPSPVAAECVNVSDHTTFRRSANFQPTIWPYDFIQSLNSEFVEQSYAEQRRLLEEEVRMMLSKVVNPLNQLELIDVMQRLGVAYLFCNEIENMLENVYNNKDELKLAKSLYATALEFRLLRQHGYNVSSEVFNEFQDDKDKFITSQLSNDIEGVLSLYEASFHGMKDENILDEAKEFTSKYLKENVEKIKDNEISVLVDHALELPNHWRMPRWEAWWFIDAYERRQNMNPTLLNLAKLDFNMVQVIHLEDLKYTSRWWKTLGFVEKMSFARDRLVENFFWALAMDFKPNQTNLRRVITKANSFLTIIDDIYDVYGTLEELELFTNTIDRWDINAMDNLPEYMKLCFLALYNFVNEEAYNILKDKGYNVISHLKKVWVDVCKAYLIEAKWYYSGYKPSLQEYMDNAWITIAIHVINVHAYFLVPDPIRKEDLDCLQNYSNIIHSSCMIVRLVDDLGSHKREMKTGDVPKSIQCYMNETGASEEDACKHIRTMINTTWKKMNEDVGNSTFPESFTEIVVNSARVAFLFYQNGDDFTFQDPKTKNRMLSLLAEPIPIICTK